MLDVRIIYILIYLFIVCVCADEREQWSEALRGVVCELLSRGAHVDAVDSDGITPLLASTGGIYITESLFILISILLTQTKGYFGPFRVILNLIKKGDLCFFYVIRTFDIHKVLVRR